MTMENEKKYEVFLTDLIKGQTDYYIADEMHNIKKILVNGKKVEYEVLFRLKEEPKKSKYDAIKILNSYYDR